jgi:hypothetical protein
MFALRVASHDAHSHDWYTIVRACVPLFSTCTQAGGMVGVCSGSDIIVMAADMIGSVVVVLLPVSTRPLPVRNRQR